MQCYCDRCIHDNIFLKNTKYIENKWGISMEKVFLFDLGNVLVKPVDSHELYLKLNCKIAYEQFSQYWSENDLVIKAHEGLVSDEAHIEDLLKYCKSDLSIDDFYEIYNSLDNSLYNDTVKIIRNLKSRNYKVGLLSNLRLMDYNRYRNKLNDLGFDYMFLSYEMKCIKPSTDIYEKVINTVGIKAQNIIFFDDDAKNVQGALKKGINAYLVTGNNIKEFFTNHSFID